MLCPDTAVTKASRCSDNSGIAAFSMAGECRVLCSVSQNYVRITMPDWTSIDIAHDVV
jgi:hypothetical protein